MIHAWIFRVPSNYMTHATSNHGGPLPDLKEVTLYKKGFQMPPLPYSYCTGVIYTIPFKMV